MCNTHIGIFWFVLHTINGFDGVRDVRKINESAVPNYDASEYESCSARKQIYVLLLEEVDQFDIAKLAEVSLKSVFSESLKVFHIANVNVSGGA